MKLVDRTWAAALFEFITEDAERAARGIKSVVMLGNSFVLAFDQDAIHELGGSVITEVLSLSEMPWFAGVSETRNGDILVRLAPHRNCCPTCDVGLQFLQMAADGHCPPTRAGVKEIQELIRSLRGVGQVLEELGIGTRISVKQILPSSAVPQMPEEMKKKLH